MSGNIRPGALNLLRPDLVWADCPTAPRADWAEEVSRNETNLGYREWALSRLEERGALHRQTIVLTRGDMATVMTVTSGRPMSDAEVLADLQKATGIWLKTRAARRLLPSLAGAVTFYDLCQHRAAILRHTDHVWWVDVNTYDVPTAFDWNTELQRLEEW